MKKYGWTDSIKQQGLIKTNYVCLLVQSIAWGLCIETGEESLREKKKDL